MDHTLDRRPEPNTRDVTLRVTVTVPAWLHPDHYEGLLSDGGDSWADDVKSVTVEVVDDGGDL